MKACDTFDQFFNDLRDAYAEAMNSDNQLGEMAILSLLQDAAKLGHQLLQVKKAAK